MREKGLVRRASNCLLEEVNPLDKCNTSCVSPTLLRALRAEGTGTPGKSILKVKTPIKTPLVEKCSSLNNYISGTESIRKLEKITFSPFNGVKVIPNRMLDRSQWQSDSESSTPIEMETEENYNRNNNENYDHYSHLEQL